jgi:hypothetical protein
MRHGRDRGAKCDGRGRSVRPAASRKAAGTRGWDLQRGGPARRRSRVNGVLWPRSAVGRMSGLEWQATESSYPTVDSGWQADGGTAGEQHDKPGPHAGSTLAPCWLRCSSMLAPLAARGSVLEEAWSLRRDAAEADPHACLWGAAVAPPARQESSEYSPAIMHIIARHSHPPATTHHPPPVMMPAPLETRQPRATRQGETVPATRRAPAAPPGLGGAAVPRVVSRCKRHG